MAKKIQKVPPIVETGFDVHAQYEAFAIKLNQVIEEVNKGIDEDEEGDGNQALL
jgi:hypothetical protein